jgi:1-aminocyclopropane-1-carboxylate deaminase/D-cysteine desulfhydrase-like pyridoxal-dependent ACC family enzyme
LYTFNGYFVWESGWGSDYGVALITADAGTDIIFQPEFTTSMTVSLNYVEIDRALNLKPVAGDITPVNGDLWYNSTTGKFMAREAGASVQLIDRPYDIYVFVQGKPTDAELVCRAVAAKAFTIPAGGTGSQATSRVASAASKVFDLLKNGVSFGSVTFATSATGTYTIGSSTSFAIGDVLTITAPATADSTLEDVSLTLAGTRT